VDCGPVETTQVKLICNINKRGRVARIVSGVILVLLGGSLIVAARSGERLGMLVGGVLLALAGAFAIFEGVRGWCALRALGFKTRL
jgi:type IV secretory pathway VirB2 component (pilin)